MPQKWIEFEFYRFQLLPITRLPQEDMFHEIRTVEDIKRNKNKYLGEILNNLPKLKHRNLELNQKVELTSTEWFAIKLSSHKSVERERKEFTKERLEHWPHVEVIINNDPNVQAILVSKNVEAFSSGAVVANLIKDSLNPVLKQYQLVMHVEAVFDAKAFWELIANYELKVISVRFELISPNMANISKVLKIDLKQINADTNSHRTVFELNSPEGSKLELSPGNEIIDGLVDYSSEGGGDISIRVKGLRKRVHTAKAVKTIEIDELTVSNISPDLLETFKELIRP